VYAHLLLAAGWGRNQEVASEDPLVNGRFGAAYTLGLQNNSGLDGRYYQAIVTLKHWVRCSVTGCVQLPASRVLVMGRRVGANAPRPATLTHSLSAHCHRRPPVSPHRLHRRPQDAYSLENSDGFTRYNFNAVVSNYSLASTYWPAFKASVQQGGAKG
jgi:hypothetical protein